MLADEIERVSSVRPEAVKLYCYQKPDALHRTWLALFTKRLKPGFRVFDKSGISSIFKKQTPIEFCKRCNGHHFSKFCSRAPSRGNCGSNMHTQDVFIAATQCRNCGGPHRSDSRKCLARPTRHGAQTKEQLKVYRQAGDREYQAAVRARAALEKAPEMEALIGNSVYGNLVPEVNEITIISVPESPEVEEELIHTFGNVTQESVEVVTDSSMQL
ncbi:putative eka-like protein [Erysiphe necator]|uniref:Putative eka-like protein n=1 Tax=Uncinula necator TaxID=52586 RepID=A0A0B1NWN4_UNCNE|nr:putative eka-like protein [Erysiphe necator]